MPRLDVNSGSRLTRRWLTSRQQTWLKSEFESVGDYSQKVASKHAQAFLRAVSLRSSNVRLYKCPHDNAPQREILRRRPKTWGASVSLPSKTDVYCLAGLARSVLQPGQSVRSTLYFSSETKMMVLGHTKILVLSLRETEAAPSERYMVITLVFEIASREIYHLQMPSRNGQLGW